MQRCTNQNRKTIHTASVQSALMTATIYYVNYSRIGVVHSRQMALINVRKAALCGMDTKRVVINGGYDSLPFGHNLRTILKTRENKMLVYFY